MKTLIAIPCMDSVPTKFVKSLLYLEKDGASVCFNENSLIYDSRNRLSLTAMDNGFDRVMWLDSDMVFMPDTLKKLSASMDEADCDFITGLYIKRHMPPLPVIYDKLEEPEKNAQGQVVKQIHEYIDYPKDSLFLVSGCGMGCCITSVKMLRNIWDIYGPAFTPYPWAGEDLSFCYRARELGYLIFCDSRVTCGHIGQMIYTDELLKRGDEH